MLTKVICYDSCVALKASRKRERDMWKALSQKCRCSHFETKNCAHGMPYPIPKSYPKCRRNTCPLLKKGGGK